MTRRWPGGRSRSASHAPIARSNRSPSTRASTRRMVASPGTWQRWMSGSRRTPSAARIGPGASAAHSAIAVTDRAPASTAAALTASTLARVWRRPRRSRGSGSIASRSSRPGQSPTASGAWAGSVAAGMGDDRSAGTGVRRVMRRWEPHGLRFPCRSHVHPVRPPASAITALWRSPATEGGRLTLRVGLLRSLPIGRGLLQASDEVPTLGFG
jgi:hypothetical protein